MLKSRTYSKFFLIYPDLINQDKINIIKQKAIEINKFKNIVSTGIHKNILEYKDKNKFFFITSFNKLSFDDLGSINPDHDIVEDDYNHLLNHTDKVLAIVEVYTTYKNELSQIHSLMFFKTQSELKSTYYKKKTSNHVKGDLKTFSVVLKETPLSKALSFLCKYLHPSIQMWQNMVNPHNLFYKNNHHQYNIIKLYKSQFKNCLKSSMKSDTSLNSLKNGSKISIKNTK